MTRIFAIIQLCLAFTYLCWVGSYPFLGEMMARKKQLFLFETVMGQGELIHRTYAHNPETLAQIERNRARFEALPEKQPLIEAFNRLEEPSFLSQLKESLSLLLLRLPPFDRAWLFFAITLSILLLRERPGASLAAWLLPLIVLAGAFDNQLNGRTPPPDTEAALFPTEEYLEARYGAKGDMESLKEAWNLYLVKEVLREEPQNALQLERAEWLFNLKRLQTSLKAKPQPFFQRKEPISLWALYLLWNLLFAWAATRRRILGSVT